eukprot:scaffold42928_cov21-Tisochrysis_lutea.AAC.2
MYPTIYTDFGGPHLGMPAELLHTGGSCNQRKGSSASAKRGQQRRRKRGLKLSYFIDCNTFLLRTEGMEAGAAACKEGAAAPARKGLQAHTAIKAEEAGYKGAATAPTPAAWPPLTRQVHRCVWAWWSSPRPPTCTASCASTWPASSAGTRDQMLLADAMQCICARAVAR